MHTGRDRGRPDSNMLHNNCCVAVMHASSVFWKAHRPATHRPNDARDASQEVLTERVAFEQFDAMLDYGKTCVRC
jgi:hypothetical protein